mgnify:CR=1 FL=1
MKMKSLSLAILAFIFSVFVAVSPAAAGTGGMQRAFPENDTAGYVPVDIIIIDPVIKAATPDYNFLVLDDEGKANYLRNLAADFDLLYASDPQKETKKAALAAKLNAIWDKYPVVSETKPGSAGYPTYGGSENTIRFAPSVTETKLTVEENVAIRESSTIMNEAFVKSRNGPAGSDPAGTPAPLPVTLALLSTCCAGALVLFQKKRGS